MTETGGPPWPDQVPPTAAQPPVTGPGPGVPPPTQPVMGGGSGALPPTYPPDGPPPTPWYKQPWPYFVAAGVVLALALILYFALRDDDDGEVTPSTTTTSSTVPATSTTLATTTTVAPTTTAATTTVAPTTAPPTTAPPTTLPPTTTTAPFSFTDGTHTVGDGDGEVPPGRYVASTGTGSDCRWKRLDGQTVLGQGEVTDPGQAVLDVLSTDGSVESQGCGRWTSYVAPEQELTQLAAGQYVVGPVGTGQIAPGSYRTDGGDDCTWARLEAFTGDPDDVIASGDATSSFTVTLAATDAGFSSTGCPGWTKV